MNEGVKAICNRGHAVEVVELHLLEALLEESRGGVLVLVAREVDDTLQGLERLYNQVEFFFQ